MSGKDKDKDKHKDKDKGHDKDKHDKDKQDKDKGKDKDKDKHQDKDKDKRDKDKGHDKDKQDKDKGKDKDYKDKDKDKKGKKDKKNKKELSKAEKHQKNEKQAKMSKEERKKFKQEKKNKKDKKKEAIVSSVNIYDPEVFVNYKGKVEEAKAQAFAGSRGEAAKQALTELATCGQVEGIQVWRIEFFHIVPVPKELYGQFFDGDSYVVLQTKKVAGKFQWDVHFWIGENSTQDEYGAAAVWAVQIDDHLGGAAVQHREVQDYESQQFLEMFQPGIRINKGGIDSAFVHVDREAHRTRLMKVKGKKNVRITEVPAITMSLNSGDVFVLDTKDEVFEWIGKSSSVFERRKAGELCTAIKNQNGGKPTIVTINEGEDNANFWEFLGGKGPIEPADDLDSDVEAERREAKKLFQVNATGITEVANGKVTRQMFKSTDAFIFDTGFEIFVWLGKGANPTVKNTAFGRAQTYLKDSGRPAFLSVTKVQEATEYPTFNAALDV